MSAIQSRDFCRHRVSRTNSFIDGSLERHRFFDGVNRPYKSHRYLLPRGGSTITISMEYFELFSTFELDLFFHRWNLVPFFSESTHTCGILKQPSSQLRNRGETMRFFESEPRVFRRQLTDWVNSRTVSRHGILEEVALKSSWEIAWN